MTYAQADLKATDLGKVLAVSRFEVLEALRSRVVALLLIVYGVGAFIGSSLFLQIVRGTEASVREGLTEQLQAGPDALPQDMVRDTAMPWLVQLVDDPSVAAQLLKMDPLSIFVGYSMLQLVPFMVLLTSASSIASDIASGSVRFVLFRCHRLGWVGGKVLGQALLLAGGLVLTAVASTAAGTWMDGHFDPERLLWLLRTAFRAWIFGLAYLGIFCGVSMTVRAAGRARARAALVWTVLGIGHAVLTGGWGQGVYGAEALAWLAPGHHQGGLWSSRWSTYGTSVGMLLALGAAGFVAGYQVFRRRDA